MPQAIPNIHFYNDKKNIPSQQRNKKRLVGILFLLSLLLTIYASSWIMLSWMKNAQNLPLSKLVIVGKRSHTKDDDIILLILTLNSIKTLIMQDVNTIQNHIKQLPWIKQANIRKKWPNEIKVHLVEYEPIARWNNRCMVDIEGNLFSVPNELGDQMDLPNLYGLENNIKEILQNFIGIEQTLNKGFLMLKDANMTNRHSWQITLTNGIKLNLGRDDIIKKLLRFIELYPILRQEEQTEGKNIKYIDLRYNSGVAVGWEIN